MAQQPNADFFWKNYKHGMDWIHKHEIAHWKSQALSLAAENETLLKIIHDHKMRLTQNKRNKKKSKKQKRRERRKNEPTSTEDTEDMDIVFEASEELKEYFRISLKHKEERKKEKELLKANIDAFIPPQAKLEERTAKLKDLYGEGYCNILGMETAIQLAYDSYVDQHSPTFWPVVPLKF